MVDLGKVGITLDANPSWLVTTVFEKLTITNYQGQSYISKSANVGKQPDINTDVWFCMTQRGESLYQMMVREGLFVGTEAEFLQQYQSTLTAAANAATTANNAATAADNARVASNQAEAQRVTAENNRALAESGRVSAENARVAAEADRASAETQRATNEIARQGGHERAMREVSEAVQLAATATNRANAAAEISEADHTTAASDHSTAQSDHALSDELNTHPMRINTSTGTWERWDAENDTYVDTEIMAMASPFATFGIDLTTGCLMMTHDATYTGPQFSLNTETGMLSLTI